MMWLCCCGQCEEVLFRADLELNLFGVNLLFRCGYGGAAEPCCPLWPLEVLKQNIPTFSPK